jgi:FtsP/CotA-like multicopper oxidase with cupredoxin domain
MSAFRSVLILAVCLHSADIQAAEVATQILEVTVDTIEITFRRPPEILAKLKGQNAMRGMKMDSAGSPSAMKMPMKADLNDVTYDAYLANYRTLSDPEIVRVEPGAEVLLRVINASSASNFVLSLGSLEGAVVVVDGESVEPLKGSTFEIAVAQRLDIRVVLPDTPEAYPILAQGEGSALQAGIVLATPGAEIPKLEPKAADAAGAIGIGYKQERSLKPLRPLPKRAVDRTIPVALGGNMAAYEWTLNGSLWPTTPPFDVKEGERVEFVFKNDSGMSHPMHLHGHKFQVTEIDGQPIDGAVRDTILVMPHSTVKVQFDADNPGLWMMHCHILWHEAAGMMGIVRYEGFPQPSFYLKEETSDLPSSLGQ